MVASILNIELLFVTLILIIFCALHESGLILKSLAHSSWHKPGCHKLGHTREISIAGCVKFNLSTNACRGYCMSYSIPTPDETIGDYQAELTDDVLETRRLISEAIAVQLDPNKKKISSSAHKTDGAPKATLELAAQDEAKQIGGDGVTSSSLATSKTATTANTPRREIISVSQCCNMMETEDVIVNLRCGANETRRLVFKSAKTCECFFCKHP